MPVALNVGSQSISIQYEISFIFYFTMFSQEHEEDSYEYYKVKD